MDTAAPQTVTAAPHIIKIRRVGVRVEILLDPTPKRGGVPTQEYYFALFILVPWLYNWISEPLSKQSEVGFLESY